jgi:hypothetical protein
LIGRRRQKLIGRTLAHYRVTARIGAGGMGEVDRATDTNVGLVLMIRLEPAFDRLCSEPGFQALLRKLGHQP